MNVPTRDLTDLVQVLAYRERCRAHHDKSLEGLAAAALPDLSPEDREKLEDTHLDYFALKLTTGRLTGSEALLQAFYVGVELGREMERWAMLKGER